MSIEYLLGNRPAYKECREWQPKDGAEAHPLIDPYIGAGALVHADSERLRVAIGDLEEEIRAEGTIILDAGDILGGFGGQVQGLLSVAPLVLPVPCDERVAELFMETRKSFAVGNYFAAACCARGCLEQAVSDVGAQVGAFPTPDGTIEYAKEWSIRRRIEALFAKMQDARRIIHDTYTRTSHIIHSGRSLKSQETLDLVEDVRQAIAALYEMHRRRIQDEAVKG